MRVVRNAPTEPTVPCQFDAGRAQVGPYASTMRVLVVGAGGVGSAMAVVAQRRDFAENFVLADINEVQARTTVDRLNDKRFEAARVDASDPSAIVALAKEVRADTIVNACDPRFNPPIFDAAYEAGCTYLDMAMTLSKPHPEKPHEKTGVVLGQYQFDAGQAWEERGLLCLAGIGVEPGLSDVFARYAADHLFESIDEVDFKARDREYAHYADWRKWHREGLPKALRRLIRRG